MKNYQKDFDEQLLMASQTDVSDGELLSIAFETDFIPPNKRRFI